jgi:hypothetical protein
VVANSIGCQHRAARRSLDQFRPGPVLDCPQVAADDSVVATQILGSFSHAAESGDGIERAQRFERRQGFARGQVRAGKPGSEGLFADHGPMVPVSHRPCNATISVMRLRWFLVRRFRCL